MRKINFIFVFLFFPFISLLAQDHPEVPAFEIKKTTLEIVEYAWGPELRMTLSGNAIPLLQESCLYASIYYNNIKIKDLDMVLPVRKEEESILSFQSTWEPLHSAYQSALPGYYEIVVRLSIHEQNQPIRERWNARYGDKIPNTFQTRVFLGSKDALEKKKQEHKDFYIEVMKRLNEIYKELQEKTQQSIKQRPFQPNVWWGWFQGSFLESLEIEKTKLERHKSKHFALIYPVTFEAMRQYVDVLVRMARFNAIDIYQHHGREQDVQNLRNIDFFGMKRFDEFVSHIQTLHSHSAKEMGIFLRKELGYLPPPGAK